MKTLSWKLVWIVSLLFSFSLTAYPEMVWSGEGGGCQLVIDETAPVVTGILIFEKNTLPDGTEDFLGMASFTGICKGKPVYRKFCFPTKSTGFATIVKADLEQLPPLSDIGFPECASFCGGEAMAITRVHSFVNTGRRITARITLKVAICQ
jgi:hypothetical protein